MALNLSSDPEQIIGFIAENSKRTHEEIRGMIDAKKEKFSGLLTESGAAFMIAKELGVPLQASEETKIKTLKDGMNNIDVVARIKNIYAPKTFEKNGKTGKLLSLILSDGTGEIRATFWNKDADTFIEQGIDAGDCIKLSNCAITNWNGKNQLNLNYNSSFEKTENSEIPGEIKITSITDLEPSEDNVKVKVKIKKMFEPKNFETERGTGKVMNFYISEGVNEIKATAWNEKCDDVEKFSEGDFVVIEGAYTKEGRDGMELHLGWKARILAKKEN